LSGEDYPSTKGGTDYSSGMSFFSKMNRIFKDKISCLTVEIHARRFNSEWHREIPRINILIDSNNFGQNPSETAVRWKEIDNVNEPPIIEK
jgi:hypothetical protein